MRALQLVIIAALSIAVPITAEAQYTTGQQTTTTATSTNDTTQSPENQWGFKADLQYFRTAGQYQTSASQTLVTTGGITTAGTTTSGITTPGGSTTPANHRAIRCTRYDYIQ